MNKKQLRGSGIACLILCVICLFVAFERYNTNAANVEAMNSLQQSSPLGGMMGEVALEPAMPAAAKYALLFAALFSVGGTVLLVRSRGLAA